MWINGMTQQPETSQREAAYVIAPSARIKVTVKALKIKNKIVENVIN